MKHAIETLAFTTGILGFAGLGGYIELGDTKSLAVSLVLLTVTALLVFAERRNVIEEK